MTRGKANKDPTKPSTTRREDPHFKKEIILDTTIKPDVTSKVTTENLIMEIHIRMLTKNGPDSGAESFYVKFEERIR